MKIIYSIGGCVFGGAGIGKTAYHSVAGFYRHGLLGQLIVAKVRPTEIDSRLITRIPSKLPGLGRVLGEKRNNALQDLLHAKLSSRVMRSNAEVFIGWAGMSLETLKKARQLGMTTILTRASSHIGYAREIIEAEYQHWGLQADQYTDWAFQRELEEYKTTDYILVPSQFARDSFLRKNFPAEKILVVPFGVEIKDHEVPVSRRAEIKGQGPINALFVGQVGIRKGTLYALEAWQRARIKKGKFFVVGPITDEIQPLLNGFRDDSSIEFLGYADSQKYYPRADVFVFPSLEEGSALVTYEAMSYGLPIITTFNSGSVVKDQEQGILVSIKNADAIKEAMELLEQNPGIYDKMSQSAVNTARDYTWFDYEENLVQEVNRVIAK